MALTTFRRCIGKAGQFFIPVHTRIYIIINAVSLPHGASDDKRDYELYLRIGWSPDN